MVVELTPGLVEQLALRDTPGGGAPARCGLPLLCFGDHAACLKLGAWLELKFGVDLRVWEKAGEEAAPSAAAHPEQARLNLSLAGETLALFEALDAKAQQLFAASKAGEEQFAWQSLVKRNDKSQYAHAVFKLALQPRPASNQRVATEMKLRLPGGGLAKGAGWSFLDAHSAACDGFRDAKCRVLFEAHFWCMNGAAGLSLNVVAVALRPSAKCMEARHFCIDDVFPDAEM